MRCEIRSGLFIFSVLRMAICIGCTGFYVMRENDFGGKKASVEFLANRLSSSERGFVKISENEINVGSLERGRTHFAVNRFCRIQEGKSYSRT